MSIVIALDLGTTGNRAIAFDDTGTVLSSKYQELPQIYPRDGWVEHDPIAIWEGVQSTLNGVIESLGPLRRISAIGITNQRETVVVWNHVTGLPIYNAIVWQCRRTSTRCAELMNYEPMIRHKTGLLMDPYFSATKLEWILKNKDPHIPISQLKCGTIDSWILYKLTNGKSHFTDVTNASRTMLWNLTTESYDPELLDLFNIPQQLLPTVLPSNGYFGTSTPTNIPITAILGDQQASLFAHCARTEVGAKLTYGTGLFAMTPSDLPSHPTDRYITTVGWKIDDTITYAREGSVFVGGSLIQWLRDGLGIIKTADEIEPLANSVPDTGGLVIIPALTGLGAPHWDPSARGLMIGMTRATGPGHIARAALEAICFEAHEIIRDLSPNTPWLNVDGGASKNNSLMQWQANLLSIPVKRPSTIETTAIGVAMMAGIGAKLWDRQTAGFMLKPNCTFTPTVYDGTSISRWNTAIERAKYWAT